MCRSFFASAAFLVLTLAGAPSPTWAETSTPPAAPADLAPSVSVVTAGTREIVDRVVVTGTLVPRDEVLVTSEVDGYRVTELLAEEGDRVKAGQVLARLSREMLDRQIAQQAALVAKATAAVTQAQASIVQAEAEQTEAKLALDRAKLLMQSGSSTAAALETRTATARSGEGKVDFARNGLGVAKADLAQAVAAQDELSLKLARTEIKAPVDGIVSRRAARVGATASSSGDPLFRMIARGEIELEADVVETRLPTIHAGDRATLTLDNGTEVRGRVRVIYPEVDRATRLGKVRVALDPDPRLHIGAFGHAVVDVAKSDGVAVPVASVLYGADKGSTVLVVRDDDHVEARAVKTGLVNDDYVAILDGVMAGERIVARAGSFLRDGDRIKPVTANATVSSAAAP